MKSVLVALPVKKDMSPVLYQRMDFLSKLLVHNNPGFKVELCIFDEQFTRDPDTRSIFNKVAKARNALIAKHLRPEHDYVLWMDADVVWYSPDLIVRLAAVNPAGVTAPLILIEPVGERTDYIFYDAAAFIEAGQGVFAQPPHFGNVYHAAPHFQSKEQVVDCDSMGCAYLIPASVHRSGVKFEATPFTDHFPIMWQAKQMGMRLCCVRHVIAHHACLPKYDEAWHSEPMEIWKDFDFAKYGLVVQPGRRRDAGPPEPPEPPAAATHASRGIESGSPPKQRKKVVIRKSTRSSRSRTPQRPGATAQPRHR